MDLCGLPQKTTFFILPETLVRLLVSFILLLSDKKLSRSLQITADDAQLHDMLVNTVTHIARFLLHLSPRMDLHSGIASAGPRRPIMEHQA